jgi:hypothetical protein
LARRQGEEHVAARRPECNSGLLLGSPQNTSLRDGPSATRGSCQGAPLNGAPSCTRATRLGDAAGRLSASWHGARAKSTSLRDGPSETRGSCQGAPLNGTPSCTRATRPGDAAGRLTASRRGARAKSTSLRDGPSATRGSSWARRRTRRCAMARVQLGAPPGLAAEHVAARRPECNSGLLSGRAFERSPATPSCYSLFFSQRSSQAWTS